MDVQPDLRLSIPVVVSDRASSAPVRGLTDRADDLELIWRVSSSGVVGGGLSICKEGVCAVSVASWWSRSVGKKNETKKNKKMTKKSSPQKKNNMKNKTVFVFQRRI